MLQVTWVLIGAAAAATGYSENAIRMKIKQGIWQRGTHWTKAPDNRVVINLPAVQSWMGGAHA